MYVIRKLLHVHAFHAYLSKFSKVDIFIRFYGLTLLDLFEVQQIKSSNYFLMLLVQELGRFYGVKEIISWS